MECVQSVLLSFLHWICILTYFAFFIAKKELFLFFIPPARHYFYPGTAVSGSWSKIGSYGADRTAVWKRDLNQRGEENRIRNLNLSLRFSCLFFGFWFVSLFLVFNSASHGFSWSFLIFLSSFSSLSLCLDIFILWKYFLLYTHCLWAHSTPAWKHPWSPTMRRQREVMRLSQQLSPLLVPYFDVPWDMVVWKKTTPQRVCH